MKTHAKLVSTILPIVIAILLAGCSGRPSENTGRAMLQHQIDSESEGKIKLVSFRKANATGADDYYGLEYEAEIEFLATGTWASGSALDHSWSFKFFTEQRPMIVFGANDVRQGERTTVKGILQFTKTEKGWRGQDGNIY